MANESSVSLPASPRILIVRLSAIGDVIHGLPVANAIRDHLPDARLAWLVEDRASCLLRDHAALDELIEVPRGWLKSPRAILALRRRLLEFGAQIAIDLQGLARSAIAARLSGAKRRIGFGCEKAREGSRWLYTQRVRSTAEHIVDCNLELLRPLGIDLPEVRFDVPERPEDGLAADAAVSRAELESGFAIINVGAGWPSKLWRTDRHAAIARHLGENHQLPSVVTWAGQEEQAMARQVVASSDGWAKQASRTTLPELAALTRRAQLFVGSDTGPLHLSAAVGTPCVALFGPTSAKRNGPHGPNHIILESRPTEGAEPKQTRQARELMDLIPTATVRDACDEILRRRTVAEAEVEIAKP